MTIAVKALEAKSKNGEKSASKVTEITTALAARRIPFKMEESTGEVHATPSYQDAPSKEFLKAKGFRWNSSGKAWVYREAA
ncbi:MAG: hypothetical protein HXX11_23810 [Desulfuromonadales bacterium]|nr:hypothetical protein [Desulfuromonadales bacterium]